MEMPDSVVLEETIDPNYEPTEREVQEYASWLGMDLEAEQELFWIAREGLKAPLPDNWKPCKTTDTEEIYYFNFATGQSTWDHPCDEYYRKIYNDRKEQLSHGDGYRFSADARRRASIEVDQGPMLSTRPPQRLAGKAVDSIVLEDARGPNYEPTEEEVDEFVRCLGIDTTTDADMEQDLLWTACCGLKAALPSTHSSLLTVVGGEDDDSDWVLVDPI